MEALNSTDFFPPGSKFDIPDFHHVFLSVGPMPLEILEEAVDEYIKKGLEQS